ncbi:cysteine proteinase inhibitor B-like protein [Carex littledalei]|uniref:Cysteine proteinase inhibitor B-like protein n=1 Tax=Carex littledalei TaxID=544730 RepID=A0A833VYB9_9POAL|nr:cysteine proteinase inhibitor B-like protein [Carex littledalei]
MALNSLLLLSLLFSLTLSTAFQISPIRLVRDDTASGTGTISPGRKVGGRSEVKNVESNKDVQELGRFAVQEYNQKLKENHTASEELLSFSQVVEAQRQVVSGLKYYMRIVVHEKAEGHGKRVFDAVVVVKPWLHSRVLVSFVPAGRP